MRITMRLALGCVWMSLTALAVVAGSPGDIVILGQGLETVQQPAVIQAPVVQVVVQIAPVAKPETRPAGVTGIVDVFTTLNVRKGPGLEYAVIGSLKPGAAVTILEQKGDWCKIEWHGGTAWICGFYVFRPGMGVRNQAIVDEIRSRFGNIPLPDRGSSLWSGEPTNRTASVDPSPVVPSGPQVGHRLSDGGLAVPRYSQFGVGGQYPNGYCGPTSMKMVLAYYGINKDVDYLALKSLNHTATVYVPGQGSYSGGMLTMLRHCGLGGSYMKEGCSIAWLKQQTDAGRPVIVNVAGTYAPGRSSSAGHYLVAVGVTSDGRVILNDPGTGKRIESPGSMFLSGWRNRSCRAIVCAP